MFVKLAIWIGKTFSCATNVTRFQIRIRITQISFPQAVVTFAIKTKAALAAFEKQKKQGINPTCN
jgi:hypothetical protein